MIYAIIILSIGVVVLAMLSIFLFYGATQLEGQRDALERENKLCSEKINLSQQLVFEKYNHYLPSSERCLTEAIFQNRNKDKQAEGE